jgi:hypothetical protein
MKYTYLLLMPHLLLLVLMVYLSSCSGDSPRKQTKWGMECTGYLSDDHSIYRCENEEAICYDHDEHLFCKFKN